MHSSFAYFFPHCFRAHVESATNDPKKLNVHSSLHLYYTTATIVVVVVKCGFIRRDTPLLVGVLSSRCGLWSYLWSVVDEDEICPSDRESFGQWTFHPFPRVLYIQGLRT